MYEFSDESFRYLSRYFAEKSYRNSKINDLLKILKISSSTFYDYFSNKECLYVDIVVKLKETVKDNINILSTHETSIKSILDYILYSQEANWLLDILCEHNSSSFILNKRIQQIELELRLYLVCGMFNAIGEKYTCSNDKYEWYAWIILKGIRRDAACGFINKTSYNEYVSFVEENITRMLDRI